MPERIELGREEEPAAKPARKLGEREARRLLLVRLGFAIVGLFVLIWLLTLFVGRITLRQATGEVYRKLQAGAAAKGDTEAQIRALGAALTLRQARTLAAGRSLPYGALSDEQKRRFAAIRPLRGPKAPELIPYQLGLDDLGGGQRQLRLVWRARGTSQPVVRTVDLQQTSTTPLR